MDWRKRWRLFIFLAIGILNTGAFFILANVLTYLFNFGPSIAAYVSYAVLVPVSFVGHRRITFGSKGSIARELIKFCVIQVTNILTIGVVTQAAKVDPMLSGWVSFAIISILIPLLNFIVLQLWVFSKRISN